MPAWTYRPTLYVKSTFEDARVTALLQAKGSPAEVIVVSTPEQEIALAEINTDQIYPLLIDRDLVVYGVALDEYVHERWPGPQLIPHEPINRAQARMLTEWIKQWYTKPQAERHSHLNSVEAVFKNGNKFFFGDQFTIVDIALLPLLSDGEYDPSSVSFANYIERLSSDQLRAAA